MMRIVNNYTETIYWRAFKRNDTAYLMGLKQGIVPPSKDETWRDDSFPEIKVEVKTGDIVFSKKVLASAGQIFKMSDDLEVTASGTLVVAAAKLVTDAGQIAERRSDIQFVDLRSFNAPVERNVSSKVETAFANTTSLESASAHEQTWSAGGKLGGTVGKKDELAGSAEVSVQFQDRVVESLKNTSTQAITNVWGQTWSDKLVLGGGKLYVIEVVWTLTLDRGHATYLGERTTFTVVRSAKPTLLKPSEYASTEELPAKYAEKWKDLTAGA